MQAKTLSSAIGSAIQEHIALSQDMQAMDFGAGTGLICAHIADHVHKIIAVDISEAMLEKLVSKKRIPRESRSTVPRYY